MFEAGISESVLRVRRESTRWLSSGWNGGFAESAVAYNISVPEGWGHTDLANYASERRQRAGFEREGPTLFTGVDLNHARVARYGPVVVYATAGISNPADLPARTDAECVHEREEPTPEPNDTGTVNLIVGTDRALGDGALANLLAVVVEAKAATLLRETGFPGTTTDAVVVGCDPSGESVEFAGSATDVGAAARACTRDAVLASLRSRYPDGAYPESVEDAKYGVRTRVRPEVDTV